MMPVNPPAASASRITAGNQNRRRMCLRSLGGALTIPCGVYDFKREPGGFAAMISPIFFRITLPQLPSCGQRGFPQLPSSADLRLRDYNLGEPEPRCNEMKLRVNDRDEVSTTRVSGWVKVSMSEGEIAVRLLGVNAEKKVPSPL